MSTLDEITKEKQRLSEALARVDAQRECFAEPLLLLGDLVQSRHFVPSNQSMD